MIPSPHILSWYIWKKLPHFVWEFVITAILGRYLNNYFFLAGHSMLWWTPHLGYLKRETMLEELILLKPIDTMAKEFQRKERELNLERFPKQCSTSPGRIMVVQQCDGSTVWWDLIKILCHFEESEHCECQSQLLYFNLFVIFCDPASNICIIPILFSYPIWIKIWQKGFSCDMKVD